MNTATTPRTEKSVVRLTEPTFTGEMHTLCQFPVAPTCQTLRRLIAGDQLVVTVCGSHVAMVLTRDGNEELFHTGFDAHMVFQRGSKQVGGTRILRVHHNHVLLWGQVQGYAPGVWLVAPGLRQHLFPLDRITGSYANGTVRMPVGESPAFPGENVIITPWGLFPVKPGSKVELYHDGTLCIVEELDGRAYAYQISAEGTAPFSPCTLDPTLRLVRFQGRHLLATRTPHRSLLIHLGNHSGSTARVWPIDGQLEDVWTSPTARAMLTLVRPRDSGDDIRRLFFNNDHLVFEGRFTLTRQDVVWSALGESFAARLQVTEDGKMQEHLVTPTESRVFSGVSVHEALVNNAGGLQAMIVNDGMWDTPVVRTRRLTAVPLAWNLHVDPDGSLVWNTVHDDLILRWVDRTHLVPRTVRV
ncbi:hypothetical protein HZA87_02170 [Candidatus Uhrbacteria bacterium]|nr:hypothetical protein [Candidatus Uhrbacteria bacterium]